MLFPLPSPTLNAIHEPLAKQNDNSKNGIYDLSGRCLFHHANIYAVRNILTPGIYIIFENGKGKKVHIR
jgi:hypothetical protein